MKEGRASLLQTFSANLLSGILALLFIYAIELILTFWFGKKIRIERIFAYLVVYLIIGAVYGTGIGAVHSFIVRLAQKPVTVRREPLFLALHVSGFLFFFCFIILNANYLPYSPIFSGISLALNFMLAFLSIAFFFYLYRRAQPANSSMPVYRTMSVCISLAAVLAILQALVSRQIGREGLALPYAAGLMFSFVVMGILVTVAESKIVGIQGGAKKGVAQEDSFKRLVFAKIVIVVIALASVSYAKRYRPLVAENAYLQSATDVSGKPNIIIMVLDTVRQDRLSTYGCERETTPNITQLAKRSWVFDAYSTISWTLGSHASIVTGRYPTETGIGYDANVHVDRQNETIAEILKENGYSTAAIISNHGVLSNYSGFAQGFDYYYAKPRETEPAIPFFASFLLEKFMRDSPILTFLFYLRAEDINDEAVRWIKETSRKPFFLFLNYMDAHAPYAPPSPYDRRWYNGDPPANLGAGLWMQDEESTDNSQGGAYEAKREYLLSQYDGEIAYLDAEIGKFLEELGVIGVFDESIIVLTSDHGEFFSEHGLYQHPQVVYEQVLSVPLIVKPLASRGESTGVMPSPVSLVHLFHSILEYAGIPHESRADSINLLEGESLAIFSEGHFAEDSGYGAKFGPHLYSLIKNNYKLIYSSKQTYEFYDLSKDPLETSNLMTANLTLEVKDLLIQMKAELDSRIDDVTAHKIVAAELPPERRDEIRAQFKALGYLQ